MSPLHQSLEQKTDREVAEALLNVCESYAVIDDPDSFRMGDGYFVSLEVKISEYVDEVRKRQGGTTSPTLQLIYKALDDDRHLIAYDAYKALQGIKMAEDEETNAPAQPSAPAPSQIAERQHQLRKQAQRVRFKLK